MYQDPRQRKLEYDEQMMISLFRMVIPEISNDAKIVRVYNNPHFLPDFERVDLKNSWVTIPEMNGSGKLVYRFTIAYRPKREMGDKDLVFVLLAGPEKAAYTVEWVDEIKSG